MTSNQTTTTPAVRNAELACARAQEIKGFVPARLRGELEAARRTAAAVARGSRPLAPRGQALRGLRRAA